MAKKPAASTQALSLEGDLDVFSIHLQWEKAQTLLTTLNGSAEVDLSAVGDLDLSGLQLLCALDRDLRSRGIAFKVVGAKPEWKTRFAPLGTAHLFEGGGA
ncbi:MAG: STAS domain-containing protein [Holophagaceae bacterium]|uniref:STAS domain-containing protein n=1 Tax=Candidatus Geothrix skivensis TaxID=2954439 RepID=A0A9D7SGM8_9BACT|nr:STAS domain-containing protein [Candidatus Geothrix skivensis]